MRARIEPNRGRTERDPGEHPHCAGYRQVLEALQDLRPGDRDVALTMRATPIRELGSRTLEEAVLAGDGEKALRYLQTISAGQNGWRWARQFSVVVHYGVVSPPGTELHSEDTYQAPTHIAYSRSNCDGSEPRQFD